MVTVEIKALIIEAVRIETVDTKGAETVAVDLQVAEYLKAVHIAVVLYFERVAGKVGNDWDRY